MKNRLTLTSRFALVAATATALCGVGSVNAVDETSAAARFAAKATPSPSPGATGSTAGTASTRASSATQGDTGATALSEADRKFITTAAADGMAEVHMGQMAVQQGQSDTVKKLGQTIVSDHSKANQELMKIAAKNRVATDTRGKAHKMSKKDMANFDQAWLAMMVKDHQKDIALYQQQAQQGSDPDLKKFAQKTLPVLQKHLKLVQSAQQKMGGGAAGGEGGTSGAQGGTATTKKGGQ